MQHYAWMHREGFKGLVYIFQLPNKLFLCILTPLPSGVHAKLTPQCEITSDYFFLEMMHGMFVCDCGMYIICT